MLFFSAFFIRVSEPGKKENFLSLPAYESFEVLMKLDVKPHRLWISQNGMDASKLHSVKQSLAGTFKY